MPAATPPGMPPHPEAPPCGTCVWRSASGCRLAARDGEAPVAVDPDTRGCVFHATTLDCLACGACCREAYDSVPVTAEDAVVRAHPELLRRDGDWLDLKRVPSPTGCGSRCVALEGNGPYTCRIYDHRPTTCRDVEVGEEGCLFARRRVGLSPKAPDPATVGSRAPDHSGAV